MDVPEGKCGYTLDPADIDQELAESHPNFKEWYRATQAVCCWRESCDLGDQGYCIWHTRIDDKPVEKLAAERMDGPEQFDGIYLANTVLRDQISFTKCGLHGGDCSGANLGGADLTDTNLSWADLSNTDLRGTDLTDANLSWADLSYANLYRTDLTDANLLSADLTDADLRGADLSYANLLGADLSYANLRGTDLTNASLQGTNLAKVILGNTTFCNVQMNHLTRFTPPLLNRFRPPFISRFRRLPLNPLVWNAHARDSHALAEKCSDEGLIRSARILTIWDRRARRFEALADRKYLTVVSSWLNWQATGHGVSVQRVARNMLILFIASTMIYLLFGIQSTDEAVSISTLLSTPFLTPNIVDTLYFSVVTFTTSPPIPLSVVSVEVSKWAAMVETFFGTLLIVLFAYVLGNREQI